MAAEGLVMGNGIPDANPAAVLDVEKDVSGELCNGDAHGAGPTPEAVQDFTGEQQAAAGPAPVAEKPVVHDFWLVKVPRPDVSAENNRMKILDMGLKEKKEKQNFINAALRLKQAARSEALSALRSARERARACSDEVRKKYDEAKPLQDMLRKLNDGRQAARAQGRGLDATSEAELNAMIAEKEHRMQHESISLKEEKQLMKEIKELEASRPKVREMEAVNVTVHESLGQKDAIQAQLKPLLAEVEVLKQERDAAFAICDTFDAEFKACEEAVKEMLAERAAVVQEQDVGYEELRALRTEVYKKEELFRQYRRDFATAQELAMAKDIAAVEKFCTEQAERIHEKLNRDASFRKAYAKANQWRTIQRFGSLDTRRLGIDEDPATLLGVAGEGAAPPPKASGAGGGGGARAAAASKPAQPRPTAAAAAASAVDDEADDGETAPKPKAKKAATSAATSAPPKPKASGSKTPAPTPDIVFQKPVGGGAAPPAAVLVHLPRTFLDASVLGIPEAALRRVGAPGALACSLVQQFCDRRFGLREQLRVHGLRQAWCAAG